MEKLDLSKFEYINKELDFEGCPIEDIEKELKRLKTLSEFYESKQNGEKLFINSIYGSLASVYCCLYRLEVAEAITLQGQDLNHYSENVINKYFEGTFQADTELHKKLGITTEQAKQFKISLGRTTDNGPLPKVDRNGKPTEYAHIQGNFSSCVAGDTDSADCKTKVYDGNSLVTIENLFTTLKYENNDIVLRTENGNEIVPVKNHFTKTFDDISNQVVDKSINYIMRHKVTKSKWKLRTKSGKEIIVTGDHSLMVVRDNKLIAIKAKDVNKKTDKVISLVKN
jgi:DNA polymerase elongation subunit (family B)